MRTYRASTILGWAIFAGLVGTVASGASPLDDDLDRLQGHWKADRYEVRGVSLLNRREFDWFIEGEKLTETWTVTVNGKITLDSTQEPRRFVRSDDFLASSVVGLYTLTDSTFKVWIAPSRQPPLEKIPDEADPRYFSETWTRVGKPKAISLDGDWRLTDRRARGKKPPLESSELTMIITGDRYVQKTRATRKLSLKLSRKDESQFIDVTPTAPENLAGKTMPGIYRLKGDRLSICLDSTRIKRPTEFATSKAGNDGCVPIELRLFEP